MFDLTKIKNASLFNLAVQTYGSDLMQRQVELERSGPPFKHLELQC